MTQQHPITPPPELVLQWRNYFDCPVEPTAKASYIAAQAAQWGADQELEACCQWLDWQKLATHQHLIAYLRLARRPKPPSLKEQALEAQQRMWDGTSNHDDWNLIRRALEALDG